MKEARHKRKFIVVNEDNIPIGYYIGDLYQDAVNWEKAKSLGLRIYRHSEIKE